MKVFCIGIGGIGVSALARYYKHKGYDVLGSDAHDSDIIAKLRTEGVDVVIGVDASRIAPDIDLVVYTIAIPDTQAELTTARELGIPCRTYAQALGDVTKEKTTIAICGTHGKTTTTAMMYSAMKACGVNPTLIVGSLLADHGTNFMSGDSEYMIVEACEYKRSFLNLYPTHIAVTNIDADHLDYYKDLDDIYSAFQSFADKLSPNGKLVTHDDVHLTTEGEIINADALIDSHSIDLSLLGDHNRENAALVIAMLTSFGFNGDKVREGLKQFKGVWRRMEYKGTTENGVTVYDDYGHHPKEIGATYEAVREKYPRGEYRIIMLFQPHLYSRTKALFSEFVDVLKNIDEVHLLPIYQARAEDTSVIDEDTIIHAVNEAGGHAIKMDSLSDIVPFVTSVQDPQSVIINMGAGNAFEELNKIKYV